MCYGRAALAWQSQVLCTSASMFQCKRAEELSYCRASNNCDGLELAVAVIGGLLMLTSFHQASTIDVAAVIDGQKETHCQESATEN